VVASGATCVPLNPDSDAEALRHLCRKLRIDAMIATERPGAIGDVATELGLPIVTMTCSPKSPAGVFALECTGERQPAIAESPSSGDIALVLHTSGTTGESKAVPLTQHSQYESTIHRVAVFGLTARDRSLCVTPMFTASSIRRSILPPLAAGGSVVCVPRFDAGLMLDWLAEFEPTFYAAGPAVHRAVLGAMERRGGAPRHALRYVVSGSTALPGQLQERLEVALGVPVIQTYAMTEAGAIAQNPLPPADRRFGSVGMPTQGEVAIVGDGGAVLPAGQAGEIIVRGPQVFAGYENDPEANRQAFIGDWFRTGDLGYLDGDGYLHVTGRLKEIINRGGFKVPSAEVDAVLLRHPAVAEAATFGIAHPTLGEDVMAAVVLHEAATADVQQLRDFAFESLAAFKVPSRISIVTSLPRTPLGKIRRRALADALAPALRPAYHAPGDAHEQAVARLFEEVLGTRPIGSLDNFFALGGDSLRGAQVIHRANEIFHCQLEVDSLFRRPTVAEFAAELRAGVRGRAFAPPPIARLPRDMGTPDAGGAPTKGGP
jgi:acyl-CoA synthetase (AMP-forming)/AMP-acid ligase II